LADLDGRLGQYHEAVALYEGLLERVPDLDAAANNMAELIADYQSTDTAALEHARRIAERFQTSTNPSHLDTLGWVYYRQGKSLQALAILEHATSLPEAPAQVHYHYGAALLAAGDKKRAADQLRLAVKPGSAYVGLDEAHRLLDTM
jgi:tetratricopeptide (TPR) repeat protein